MEDGVVAGDRHIPGAASAAKGTRDLERQGKGSIRDHLRSDGGTLCPWCSSLKGRIVVKTTGVHCSMISLQVTFYKSCSEGVTVKKTSVPTCGHGRQ